MDDRELQAISEQTLSRYLQSWGLSIEQKIEALNSAAKAAGLNAEFKQGNGFEPGWYGPDCDRATEFRQELDRCWPLGRFEDEAAAVKAVIQKYSARQ